MMARYQWNSSVSSAPVIGVSIKSPTDARENAMLILMPTSDGCRAKLAAIGSRSDITITNLTSLYKPGYDREEKTHMHHWQYRK